MSAMQVDSTNEIDESLYSRQLYVLGKEAMQKMAHSNVLVIGLKGLGVEIAKNVALAGVKSLSIYDPNPAQVADLSAQFFLSESDIGKARDQVTKPKLAELNSYVPISVVSDISPSTIKNFQVVVVTDASLESQLEISKAARDAKASFISADIRGLFGQVFVDNGDDFVVVDQNGEEPKTGIITDIDAQGTVVCLDETRHGLSDGDYVKFDEVEGLAVGDGQVFKVTVNGPYTFSIGAKAIEGKGKYVKGGIFTQVKQPIKVQFESFETQLGEPEFLISDFAKFDRPAQLHVGFLALHGFQNKNNGRLPKPRVAEDAKEFLVYAKNVAAQYPEILGETDLDEKLLTEVSYQATGYLAPMAAFYGGLVAQEVLKACSGKFTPLKQWMYFDSLESLPTERPTASDCAPKGSRYDALTAVFGAKFVERLHNLNVFLVGSGAIGCEMLKEFAMLGIGSGPKGKITVTDNDSIEKSNLNRQFLFRPKDVGKQKSEVAALAAVAMNPHLEGHIVAEQDKVGPETEDTTFNESFWQHLDIVVNALDNVEARQYIDRRCVFFKKPLLESGTLGTKGNIQVVLPNLTESYSSSQDPPEQSIPLCTLRSFPNKIDHTIAWAKSVFSELFTDSCENVNLYLSQPDYVESTLKQSVDQKSVLETIYNYLGPDKPLTFEQCIEWARREFEEKFVNNAKQLLYNFPVDAKTTSGTPFWGGPKRAPMPLVFDPENPDHMGFIVAAANLHAYNFGLKGDEFTLEKYKQVLAQTHVPVFEPASGVSISTDESETAESSRSNAAVPDSDILKTLAAKLPPASSLAGFRLTPVEFEKDDDTNHHIDFITYASNLRAANYGIEPADKSKTKFIAGRIIPAIATTTALVTGLVGLELTKVVDGKDDIEQYKNGFVNLALPFFGFSEPIASGKSEYNGKKFDQIWDRFEVSGDLTLKELLDKFKEEEGLTITMLSSGSTLLYAMFHPPAKVKERLPMKIPQLVEFVSNKKIAPGAKSLVLEVLADDKDDEEAEVPYICVKL